MRIRRHRDGAKQPAMVHVTTVPCTLFFLRGQAACVRDRLGLAVHAISAPGADLRDFGEREGVAVHPVRMERRITPLRDARAAWEIWRVLRRVRPLLVDAHTPKGGLLGMIGAALAGVPARIYHVHGMPFVTATGPRRWLLRWSERVSCALAHRVLAVSRSVAALAVEEGVCPAAKIDVLRDGSINGVDADDFRPATPRARGAVRGRLGIGPEDLVVGFVGRLARDKGVAELAHAWGELRQRHPRLRLLLVGSADASDPLPAGVLAALRADPRVVMTGLTKDVAPLYGAMDVLTLPTYREGFTVVALEAAASGLPIVGTSVPGCLDAVEDGVTGLLVPPRDPDALVRALERYVLDAELRRAHGEAGRHRVLARYRREDLWDSLAAEYEALLAARAPAARGARAPPADAAAG